MGAAMSKAQIGRIMDAFSERGKEVREVVYKPNGEIVFLTDEIVRTSVGADPIDDEIAALKARYGQD